MQLKLLRIIVDGFVVLESQNVNVVGVIAVTESFKPQTEKKKAIQIRQISPATLESIRSIPGLPKTTKIAVGSLLFN